MVQSGVGYCRCGQELWLEYLRRGDEWFCRFSTPEAGEVSRCPACGRLLVEDELEPPVKP